jgi:excisionase family DNA binding protein
MSTPEQAKNLAEEVVEDGLCTVKEAGAFLRVSIALIYRLMETGKLPYAKIGRCRRIPRRALVELAARHLVGGHSE